MRFGLVIDTLDGGDPLGSLVRQASEAEDAGFDLVWLAESATIPSPAVSAAALAPHTATIRVGAAVEAGVNPVYLAEEAAVADLTLGGRLVLALGAGDAGLLGETADVLLAATAARPFRHEGEQFRIPANLAQNEVNCEERVRVTPATAQLELPIWLTGPHAADVAVERCLSFVAGAETSTETLAEAWRQAGHRLGPAVNRLRRVAIRDIAVGAGGTVDDDAVVRQLRADQRAWGLDVVLVRLPGAATADTRLHAVGDIAARVMPRVQLDRLPPGLETYWKQRQEATT
jgi:alkanesulfonate monooxygenase SsuD/methylene tetrahydromethanopterin reductase-like flavin-dependent oxidoreductase (luciferase family)